MSTPLARPLSQPRPTQAYYVPRRLLEGGRGPTVTDDSRKKEDKKSTISEDFRSQKIENSKSPTETNYNKQKDKENRISPNRGKNRAEQRRSFESPRNDQNQPRRGSDTPRATPRQQNRLPNAEKPQKYDSPKENRRSRVSPTASLAVVHKAEQLTTSEPRVISPSKTAMSRPNAFSATGKPDGKECICNRPETHVVCKRCGFECSGRVLLVCALHPNKLSLMDLRECPNPICRSIQILEMPTATN